MPSALADSLSDRVERFPYWQRKPNVTVVNREDLLYPDWMAGTWDVTSTLLQLEAPLAPDLKSPGFEGNRRYLNQPLSFQVRFQANPKAGGEWWAIAPSIVLTLAKPILAIRLRLRLSPMPTIPTVKLSIWREGKN